MSVGQAVGEVAQAGQQVDTAGQATTVEEKPSPSQVLEKSLGVISEAVGLIDLLTNDARDLYPTDAEISWSLPAGSGVLTDAELNTPGLVDLKAKLDARVANAAGSHKKAAAALNGEVVALRSSTARIAIEGVEELCGKIGGLCSRLLSNPELFPQAPPALNTTPSFVPPPPSA